MTCATATAGARSRPQSGTAPVHLEQGARLAGAPGRGQAAGNYQPRHHGRKPMQQPGLQADQDDLESAITLRSL